MGEIIEVNKEILEAAGAPETHKLLEKSPLLHLLSELRSRDSQTSEQKLSIVAELIFGVARRQTFADGNRRTALQIGRLTLANNELSWISPAESEDDMLARYLNNLVEPERSGKGNRVEDFTELLRRRLAARKPRRDT